MMQKSSLTNTGVSNQAVRGNAVLPGWLGPPLLQRYNRDLLLQTAGTRRRLIFDDIGSTLPDATT